MIFLASEVEFIEPARLELGELLGLLEYVASSDESVLEMRGTSQANLVIDVLLR